MDTRIKIKSLVTTSQYGVLTPDTELRTSAEFARHLVEECQAAEYVKTQVPPKPAPIKAAQKSSAKE